MGWWPPSSSPQENLVVLPLPSPIAVTVGGFLCLFYAPSDVARPLTARGRGQGMAMPTDARSDARYLGDGVYASYDGYQLKLFTHNGISTIHTIFLDPGVLQALQLFMKDKLIYGS